MGTRAGIVGLGAHLANDARATSGELARAVLRTAKPLALGPPVVIF